MPKVPGVNHRRAIKALRKDGFEIVRESKHVVMAKGNRVIVIPRANPINGYTLAAIIKDAGLTIEQFTRLL